MIGVRSIGIGCWGRRAAAQCAVWPNCVVVDQPQGTASERCVARNGRPVHVAARLPVVAYGLVHSGPVIPHYKITDGPAMTVDELWLSTVCGQECQQCVALLP